MRAPEPPPLDELLCCPLPPLITRIFWLPEEPDAPAAAALWPLLTWLLELLLLGFWPPSGPLASLGPDPSLLVYGGAF